MTNRQKPIWARFYSPNVDPFFEPEPICVNRLIGRAFAQYEDRIFIEYRGEEISYGEMRRRVGQASAALRAAGILPGDRVALHLPNCPWHPVLFFGALAVGATVTHLSPLDAPEEIASKVEDTSPKLLFSTDAADMLAPLSRAFPHGNLPPIFICPDAVPGREWDGRPLAGARPVSLLLAGHEPAEDLPLDMPLDHPALLQFTGGTTGAPKAAVLTHGNLSAAAQTVAHVNIDEPAAQPGKKALQYAPLFHIMGLVGNMMRRAQEGGYISLRQRFDAAACIDDVERLGINTLAGVPTMWIGILGVQGISGRDLSSLDYVAASGAPLPREVYNRILALTGLRLRGGWGMTESSALGCQLPRNIPEEKLGATGIPNPAMEFRVVDPEDPNRVLAIGETGEFILRGPSIMKGYWNRPEETAAAFHEDWLLTGDIGYMDEDGFVFLVDRKKDVILSGGYNVYPLTIENAIHRHPDVSEAIVIGVPDAYRGESAKAFICLNQGASPFTLKELQDFLSDKIGRHEVPRFLEFRDSLPRTAVGKASRRVLKDEEAARLSAGSAK
ncbi:long-chain fatty acid--CoA ligase [Martelella lutilitoris]|uniref:Long-chain-fatty-acid--CoA ligase n=1 Tax=Martelella lutilitoris TaxID=2583532 RepID=A0A5C4JQU7_9HYPH|nr:AMP-binding protein [Martelella lutilitoris]TNB47786.1 long-chain fatty acid--CoA ligase [Martelella lutilitoris]